MKICVFCIEIRRNSYFLIFLLCKINIKTENQVRREKDIELKKVSIYVIFRVSQTPKI